MLALPRPRLTRLLDGAPSLRSPAVILLHHYSWWFTYGDGVDRGLYYRMGEAQLGLFSNYYDMPQVCAWTAGQGTHHACVSAAAL